MDETINVELITDVVVEDEIDVSINNNNAIEIIEEDNEFEVTVQKREYVITGDDMYIPISYDDSPQWLKDTINNITNFSLNQKLTELGNLSTSLMSLISELEIAKNTYTQSIISSADINSRINSAITTLNSSLSESDANIVGLLSTKSTPEEASAIAIDVLTSSINNGAISSLVGTLQNTITTIASSLSNNIDIVNSEMTGEFEITANGMQSLSSYVGVDSNTYIPNGTGILAKVDLLEKQADGVIDTITGTYDVMSGNSELTYDLVETAEPYASWISSEVVGGESVRASHIGDTYIKYQLELDGSRTYLSAYKFIKTIVDNTAPYGTDNKGYTWAIITNTDTQNAYMAALKAYDLADNKRRVFVSTPVVPYDIGDLWLVQTGAGIIGTTQGGIIIQVGDMLRCAETKGSTATYENNDWIPADSYREGMNAIQTDLNGWRTGTYALFVSNIQSQVDGKAETFYQNSIPIGRIKSINVANSATLDKYVGDLWKNTYIGTISGYLGDNTEYIYTKITNGSNWNYDWTKMEVPDIVFDTIDTKKSIYSGNSVPVAIAPDVIEVNDMWITGSGVVGYDKESIYVWSGTAWIKPLKYTDDTAVVTLSNGLANGTANINLSSATIDGSKALTNYIAEEIDKEVVVYSGTNHASQTGMKLNDIYIEKTTAVGSSGVLVDVVNTWKYNGTAWAQISNNDNLTKLADLTDGKRTIYSGSSLPVNGSINPLKANDLFIPISTFAANTVTYVANEMYRYDGSLWQKATRYDEIKSALSLQIDSKIETTYGGINPPVGNQTNVTKDTRGGDYWYCDTTGSYIKGNIYKYVETANGSNYNYTWTLSSDISKSAFDLADKKRIIFGNAGNSTPTTSQGLALSDIWIPSSSSGIYTSGKVYKCTNLSPVAFIEVDYTNDEAVNSIINGSTPLDPSVITIGDTSTTFLDYINSEIDKKVAIYSGENAPVASQPIGVAANDIYLWFTTASKVLASGATQVYDITRTYKYSGSTWAEITTDSNITALADLADGKRTVFSGNTVPVGAVIRDLWIPSATNGSYLQGEIYQYNGTSWVIATKYSSDIAALSSSVQTQIDSKVDTYYQTSVPFANATNVAKRATAGDYWYCSQDIGIYLKGKIYKYVESANGSNYNYTWTLTTDISRDAFDLADGKSTIYTTASQPTKYNMNDMMIVVSSFNNGTTTFSDGVVLTATVDSSSFVASHWVKKINDTEDLDAYKNVVNPQLTSLQSQLDGKIEIWYTLSTNDPKVAWTDAETKSNHNGDMWYQTDTKISYYYSNITNTWNLIDDAKAILALSNAAIAQATADGVVVSYYAIKQDTAPAISSLWLNKTGTKVLKKYTANWVNVTVKQGDTLTAHDPVTKDISVYVYNGTGWITNTENGVVASAEAITKLDADLTSLGTTVGGHTTQLSTVDARIASGVATVDSKWQYGSNLIIGGVSYTSGFGLNSTFTGTPNPSNPPVGTSEFWINADQFKLTTTGYTGTKYSPFSVNGTTGEITFNGKVSFTNTTGVPDFATDSELTTVANSVTALSNSLSSLSDSVESQDGLISTFYSTTAPVAPSMNFGDYWLDTDSAGYTVYRYQGAGGLNSGTLNWVVSYSATAKSLQNAYSAQKVAEGKVNTYYQTTAPTDTLVVGDIWIDTDDNYQQYRWSGSAWVAIAYNPATAVNSGTTTINGPKITAGTITADQITANSVSADRFSSTTGLSSVWTGGGLISANFNGNVNGAIGGPTSGFRLSSNAAGTSADPNIYGAYIKGSTLEGVSLSVNDVKVKSAYNPNNFGPIMLYSSDSYERNTGIAAYTFTTPTFISGITGGGYDANRQCSGVQKFNIEITAASPPETIWTVTVNLYVSVNGTGWQLIRTVTSNATAFIAHTYYNDGWNTVVFHVTYSSNLWMEGGMFKLQSINGQ